MNGNRVEFAATPHRCQSLFCAPTREEPSSKARVSIPVVRVQLNSAPVFSFRFRPAPLPLVNVCEQTVCLCQIRIELQRCACGAYCFCALSFRRSSVQTRVKLHIRITKPDVSRCEAGILFNCLGKISDAPFEARIGACVIELKMPFQIALVNLWGDRVDHSKPLAFLPRQ